MFKNKKGFTLIELLVVIAIIGLLSTLAVVALSSARQKSRDAKRIADVKQLETALEMYFADNNAYPIATTVITLGGTSSKSLCSGGFVATGCTTTIYMGLVPSAPTPPTGNVYTYVSDTNGSTFTITFTLEGATGGLANGNHTATPVGLQ